MENIRWTTPRQGAPRRATRRADSRPRGGSCAISTPGTSRTSATARRIERLGDAELAEVNLVSLLGELGAAWSRWGERLIPFAKIYDPFVFRALEPWSYGIYAGGQSIRVGTPSIGLEQPGCVAWEPPSPRTSPHAMERVGVEGALAQHLRLTVPNVRTCLGVWPLLVVAPVAWPYSSGHGSPGGALPPPGPRLESTRQAPLAASSMLVGLRALAFA